MPTQSPARELKSEGQHPTQLGGKNRICSQSWVKVLTGKTKRVSGMAKSVEHLTKVLKKRENRVLGVEIGTDATEMSRQICKSTIKNGNFRIASSASSDDRDEHITSESNIHNRANHTAAIIVKDILQI